MFSHKMVRERSRRVVYENCQEWRAHSRYADAMPSALHRDVLRDVKRSTLLAAVEEKEDILMCFHDHEKFRLSIERSIGRHRNRTVTMLSVPNSLAYLGSERFLHVHTQDMHIYYSVNIIRLAYNNLLEALVADGVFSMHPNVKEKNGQLYTIHGVCNAKVEYNTIF
ncbi:unnamed protein product [Heligmosomoides polygyrus]|uniref:DNA-directed RNA polymerase n=1 Tax=Heligmosomoides polygyrus TaxID=6339 RepID=A0A183FGF3_HELPZ|nr:unnamed protein product [Heligmosomoides polygyrus]